MEELLLQKLFFYINAIHEGGAERVMVNLAKQFADDGFDTTLITSYQDTWEYPVDRSVKRLSLEDEEIVQSKLRRNLSRIKKLRKVIKREKPDAIISFMAEPNYRTIISCIGLPVKTIISVRNDPEKEYAGTIGRFLGKGLLPVADGCVFQTPDAQKWFPRRLQKKSCVIYNAVKEDFYHVDRMPVKGKVVTCGRLEEQKNHELLINAFSKTLNEHPGAHLDIYGNGSLKEKLQNQILEMQLQDKVTLCTATDDVCAVLREASVFVLSSDYEGMPNALMEALAAGVPSISTNCPCGGPRLLIDNGRNGLLVSIGDVDALSEAMSRLLTDEKFAEQISRSASESAKEYIPDRVYDIWKKYIASVCEEEGCKG